MKSPILVLASGSPRRAELLKLAGYRFKILKPHTDEVRRKKEPPKSFALRLAREKADFSVNAWKSKGPVIILSADTIVVTPNGQQVLGKPVSQGAARKMLKILGGRTHKVITAYCVIHMEDSVVKRRFTRAVQSKVTFRALSSPEITRYVQTTEPMDKAGSYAAQGRGMIFISKVVGSYTNVVGLPMAELVEDLQRKFGVTAGEQNL